MTNGDSAAYPFEEELRPPDAALIVGERVARSGLTKREYFAAVALSGMMSPNPTMGLETDILATCAVQFADALIEALNK